MAKKVVVAKQAKPVKPVKPVKKPITKSAKIEVKAKAKVQQKKGAAQKVAIETKPKAKVTAKAAPKAKVQPPITEVVSAGPYEEIKKMLLRQKKAILVESGVLLENTLNPASEVFPDWTDQASVEMDQNFVLRLREREQQLLKKIEDAIERIDGETFGVCESCGGEISLKRLKARPVTTLCIDCKTKQELDEKMRQ